MKRRQFLRDAAMGSTALLGGMGWTGASAQTRASGDSKPRLRMPPLLEATDKGRFELVAQAGLTNFTGIDPTPTIGYNQPYLGPTLRLANGDYDVTVENQLNEPITAHWHGLVVPGDLDGGPHQSIASGAKWTPALHLSQPPCTAWYHTHAHQRTAIQVHSGLAGVIQLTDGQDRDRGLPERYGIDDLTLVLQDRRFDRRGRMVYGQSMMDRMHGFVGDSMLINGQYESVAAVPQGIVRLRLLNGSNARIYTLFMHDRREMHLIATDGGFLPESIAMDQVRLAPGERVELLVDFSSGLPTALMSEPDINSGPGNMMGVFRGNARGRPFTVLPFAIDDTIEPTVRRVADKPGGELPKFIESDIVTARRLSLDVGMGPGMMGRMMRGRSGGMTINGQPYQMDRVDMRIQRGKIERWLITTTMLAHPFHIHGLQFQVLSENGHAPRAENTGWKDTVLIERDAEILVRFDQTAPEDSPYMAHCHILEHEDAGMMLQFSVT